MNSLQDLLDDLNRAWKNMETNLNGLNLETLQSDWKRLFESPGQWWQKLSPEWQSVFKSALKIYTPQQKIGDLEMKKILSLTKLDCSDSQIVNLEPLRSLKLLQEIDFSNTNITNLEPLQALPNLLKINASNTQIHDLKPLKKLVSLRSLNISMTDVDDFKPLRKLINLKEIDCHATFVRTLQDLDYVQKIQFLNCENTPLSARAVRRFQKRHPQAQLVFTFPPVKSYWWKFW
jgi:internalin A